MSSCKQQALIEAPVDTVWGLIEDPARFSEWSSEVEVTGAPTKVEKGSTFQLTGRGPLHIKGTTTYKVEEYDEDLREIKLRCQRSGFYSHWLLTDARGSTFADVEYGVEPVRGLDGRATGAMHTKRYMRRALDRTVESLRRAVSGGPSAS